LPRCDRSTTPGQGTTSGSQSQPTNFNQRIRAQAAATAREALLQLAATRLGVGADRLVVADGVVRVAGDASKSASYGDLVGGRRFNLSLNPRAARRPRDQWTGRGTAVVRLDLPGRGR